MTPATTLDAVRPFLDGPQRAVLATSNPDGSPHLVVVDYLVQDGALLLNGRSGRRWVSNLRRLPRATALVHDPADVQHWVRVAGPATLLREGDEEAIEDAKVMARRYGDDTEQFDGQHRVSWHLRPERVVERR
ncbi:MAG TPA: TIGR03618 family F420-dependent PPOX class oxidoreductase [Acidimicrobiales bacterium]|nr:TIGR03618 family F420-dependent PPOX class oxidoreductase [Acidimicrobiales bacterium]